MLSIQLISTQLGHKQTSLNMAMDTKLHEKVEDTKTALLQSFAKEKEAIVADLNAKLEVALQEKASAEKLRDEALEDKAAAAQCNSELCGSCKSGSQR